MLYCITLPSLYMCDLQSVQVLRFRTALIVKVLLCLKISLGTHPHIFHLH